MITREPIDKKRIADLLAGASDANKSANHRIGRDGRRKARIPYLMGYPAAVSELSGTACLTDGYNTCALLLYPQKQHLKSIFFDTQMILNFIGIAGISSMPDWEKGITITEKKKMVYPCLPGLIGNCKTQVPEFR